MRSSAQNRFTAVGGLAASVLNAASIAVWNSRGGRPRCLCASGAMPKAAAQPMAGAPRTTWARIAAATWAAFVQLRYSRRSGRARWSISSSRAPRQRRVSTGIASDDALIAAVHGHLRAGGLGEKRPAHLRRQLGDLTPAHVDPQHALDFRFLHGHRVLLLLLVEHLLGAQAVLEHRLQAHRVHTYAVRTPFQR